ncbi:ABC transporter permease [Companilactobacillus baiquanensis]|uniref:ABC transporter permease n=1 Tax=Companilactobacillus baiquanensis TaxID=2486005 RepID=A0ABW1UWT7_9LACO|nr:ABC transporter permease [Companilactobacillus baiquanensis]
MLDKVMIALKSIGKNKNRNFLTMLGIIIGIASVICILAIGDGFTHVATKGMQDHNTKNKVTLEFTASSDEDTKSGFTRDDLAVLEGIKGVDHVKLTSSNPEASVTVQHQTKKTSATLNKVPKRVKLYRGFGTILNSDDTGNIFISKDLADRAFKGKALNKRLVINDNVYVVSGIYKIGDFEYRPDIYVSKTTFKQLFAGQISQDEARLSVQPSANKKAVGKSAVNEMKKFGEDSKLGKYSISHPDQISKSFTKTLNNITYFVAFVAGISLLIAGIGVMNVMYITVSERRKEIGIRRAFGATAGDIRNQFLIESIVLCVIGGLIGIALGYGVVQIINSFLPFKAVVTTYAIIMSLSVSTIVGLVFGFIPANKAAKSPLVGLLKEE